MKHSGKFNKFNYQLIKSNYPGFKEVLVTFAYQGEVCHYYSFHKEKAGMKNAYYLSEAKKEINSMIKNQTLEERAKRYINF